MSLAPHVPPADTAGFDAWVADLETRHLRDLTPAEVARALRALSSTYVERRARLSGRGAYDSAGKRAAYALYYAPRRFLTIRAVLARLDAPTGPRAILDLGCGTGAAGAAWAVHAGPGATVRGVDVHPWALDEARATWRAFGVPGDVRRGGVVETRRPAPSRRGTAPQGVMASCVANELDDADRAALLDDLLGRAAAGAQVLVMEPLSRRTSPWWPAWTRAIVAAGGRHDEWRLPLDPPPITRALGRAAGLDPIEASGRTLWLARG